MRSTPIAEPVRNDILISYLTGLGPVGEPVECPARYVETDMGWTRGMFHNAVNRLIRQGRVRRFAHGNAGCGARFIVLRRLEAV